MGGEGKLVNFAKKSVMRAIMEVSVGCKSLAAAELRGRHRVKLRSYSWKMFIFFSCSEMDSCV